MTYRTFFFAAVTVISLNPMLNASAQEMDVDQADSLRFGEFHTDKKASIKTWEKKPEATKTYSETAAPTKTINETTSSSNNVSSGSTANSGDIKGKRFELRERYTLTHSVQTPYSAFYVIEPMYKQSAQLCAKGWRKLAERSEPIEQDFYLYYEIECL